MVLPPGARASPVGWVWIGHAAITSHTGRADGLFLRHNLLLLLVVAFLPFPTHLMAEYFGRSSARSATGSAGS